MAKTRGKMTIKAVKEYLTPLKQSSGNYYLGPTLEPYSSQRQQESSSSYSRGSRHYVEVPVPTDEEVQNINRDRLEQAKLMQDKESLDLTLRSQHKILIATLITALVAILTSLIALTISLHNKAPTVYVKPNIKINK
jgi:hypothetical protein